MWNDLNRDLSDMKTLFQFHPCPAVADDHGSQEQGYGCDHGKKCNMQVSFQNGQVEQEWDQAAQDHQDLPHDVALPVASVKEHASQDDHIHDQNSGWKYVVQ